MSTAILRVGIALILSFSFSRLVWGGEWAAEIGTLTKIESAVLGREMTLVIHLPPGYEGETSRYPVFYMIGSDFRARFTLAASTLDYMYDMGQIPPMILVGLDLPDGNGVFVLRGEDPDTTGPDRHMKFLLDEVIPLIDGGYRTVGYRVLYGASNSGLFVIYTLLSQPSGFGAFVASSPTLGWCANFIEAKATEAFEKKASPRQLVMVYSDDDFDDLVVDAVPGFLEILEAKKPAWLEWTSEVRHNEGHVPVVDIPLALKVVFPDYNPEEKLESLGQFVEHFDALSKRYGYRIAVPSSMLFDLGMDHYTAKRLDQAEEVFKFAAEAYPGLSRPWSGLGLVARERGDIEQARGRFEKALELDPNDPLPKRLLGQLPLEE